MTLRGRVMGSGLIPIDGGSSVAHLDMPDGTFATPDLTTFCRLDGLDFVVTGQRIEADRRSWRAGSLRNDGASGGDLHRASGDRVDEPTIAQGSGERELDDVATVLAMPSKVSGRDHGHPDLRGIFLDPLHHG